MSSQDLLHHRHTRRGDAAVVPSLDLSSAEEDDLRAPFKHSLFAKVLGKRIEHCRLSAHLRSVWRPAGPIDFIPLARAFYLVNFSLPSDYEEVLDGFPWTIDDHYIVLLQWDPNFKPSEAIISLVAVWVRLPELQVQYYDEEILQKIGELIGEEVVKIDSCTRNRTKCKYARLCILIDLGKPVIPMIEIGGALQPIQYEGLHLLCYTCGQYGHRQEHCHHLASSPAAAIQKLCFSGQTSTESLRFRHRSHLYGPWLQVRRGYQHQNENQVLQPEKKSVSLTYRPIKTAFIPCNNILEHGEGTSGVAETVIGSSMKPRDQEASSSGRTDTVTSSTPSPFPALRDPYVPVSTQSPEVPRTNTPTPSPALGDNPYVPVSTESPEVPQTNNPTPSLGDLNVSTSVQTGTSSLSPALGDNPHVPVLSQPREVPQTNTPTPSLGDLNASTSAQTGTSSPSLALGDRPNIPVSTQPPEISQTNSLTPSLGDLNVSTSVQTGFSSLSPALGDNPHVPVLSQPSEVPQTNTPTPSLGDLNASTSAQTGTSSPSLALGDRPNTPVSTQPPEISQTNSLTPSRGDLNVSTSVQTGTSSLSPALGDNPHVPVLSQPPEVPQTNTPTPSLGDLNATTSAQTGTSSPFLALGDSPNIPVSTQPPEISQTNSLTPSLGVLNVSTSAQTGTSSPSPALSDNPGVPVSTQPPEVPQTNTPTPSFGDLNVSTSVLTSTSSTSPALGDPDIPASTQPPEVSQTSTPPPPSPSNASVDPYVSASSRVDFPSPQHDSPIVSISTDPLPHQRAGAGITNQQQPPPQVIEFYSRVIQSLTTSVEINSSDVSVTELVIEGKPQVITFDSKISNVEMRVNMSGLVTWNTNQHNVSFSTTVIDHTEYPVQKPSKKLLIWNCRGAGDAKLLPTVKALCQQHQPSAVLLLETRISGPYSDQAIEDIGFFESLVVEPVEFTGGMWLLWHDNDIEVDVYSATPLHVAIEFLPKPETLILYGMNPGIGHEYSGVYGIDSSDSDHSSQTRSPEVFNLDQQIGPQTSHWIRSC